MTDILPDKINLFNVYKDGRKLIGVSGEVTLPDYEQISETVAAAGILGEFELPAIGHFGSNQIEIPFVSACSAFFDLIKGSYVLITLRASQQSVDGSGAIVPIGTAYTYGGYVKSIKGGTLKQGAGTAPSVTIEICYTKIVYDGAEQLEIDKLNSVYKVKGEDLMKKYRDLA